MKGRVIIVVTCSLIAATLVQLKKCIDKSCRYIHSKDGAGLDKEIPSCADVLGVSNLLDKVEVKCLSSESSNESEMMLLPEFNDLLQASMEFPSDSERSVTWEKLKYDMDDSAESRNFDSDYGNDEPLKIFEALASFNTNLPRDSKICESPNLLVGIDPHEIVQLKMLVADLQHKEMKLEAELLEYYELKEQERNFLELGRQVQKKNAEIESLHGKIALLENETKKLKAELLEKGDSKKELESARAKIKELQNSIRIDNGETKAQLLLVKQQLSSLHHREKEVSKVGLDSEMKLQSLKELEAEVVELRRTRKELQHEKRELAIKLAVAEATIAQLSSITENELILKAEAEASVLMLANEDLKKQVEGLQANQFSEIEAIVYLRWINACLRYQLRNCKAPSGKMSALELGKRFSPGSQEKAKQLMLEYGDPNFVMGKAQELSELEYDSISSLPSSPSGGDLEDSSFDEHRYTTKRSRLRSKVKRRGQSKTDTHLSHILSSLHLRNFDGHCYSSSKGPLVNSSDSVAIRTFGSHYYDPQGVLDPNSLSNSFMTPPREGQNDECLNSVDTLSNTGGSLLDEIYLAAKDRYKLALTREKILKQKAEHARNEKLVEKLKPGPSFAWFAIKSMLGKLHEKFKVDRQTDMLLEGEKTPKEPEINKMNLMEIEKRGTWVLRPPPRPQSTGPSTPLPPPGSVNGGRENKVQIEPQIVEFYQSLMRRETKKEVFGAAGIEALDAQIGEIENWSSLLLAVKSDVTTQEDFVQSLATEVRNAAYDTIEDVVMFVSWLDEELAFLVGEHVVLKHLDWPESKTDALREAAFEYQELERIEAEVSSFEDDPHIPCETSLKEMLLLLEKMEKSLYGLLQTQDMAVARYREFSIPTEWLLDSGLVGKIKFAAIQLARKYMKRIALELDALATCETKESQAELLLLQGVQFAFRVHQFAGRFDTESMSVFEELKKRAHMNAADHDQKLNK